MPSSKALLGSAKTMRARRSMSGASGMGARMPATVKAFPPSQTAVSGAQGGDAPLAATARGR